MVLKVYHQASASHSPAVVHQILSVCKLHLSGTLKEAAFS